MSRLSLCGFGVDVSEIRRALPLSLEGIAPILSRGVSNKVQNAMSLNFSS